MRSVLTMLLVALPGVAVAESYVPDVTIEEVDVLVVLDSAPTAAGARAALAAEIGAFVTQLEDRFPNEYEVTSALSLHLGFITGDLGAGALCGPGDDARLRIATADCFTTATPYPWVIAETTPWGELGRNFEGMTADAVRCAMPVALDGCAFQQPLRASLAALDGSASGNAGFLRPDAVLAVLFVTTQDDCSVNDPDFFQADTTTRACAEEGWACLPAITATPQTHTSCFAREHATRLDGITDTVAALRALKANPDRIVVGVLRGAAAPVEVVAGGTLAPSCGAGTDRAATPGLRLDALAAQLGGVTGSVCDDVAAPLAALVDAIDVAAQASPWGDYDPPSCDGGFGSGDDDLGGAPPETASGSAFGCDAGGGAGGLGVLLLLSLAAATARRGCRRDP